MLDSGKNTRRSWHLPVPLLVRVSIASGAKERVLRVGGPGLLRQHRQPIVRDLVCDILHESGYRTLPASNGKEAIDLAQRHLPSLIVLDLMMPAMDGYTTMTRLRRDPGTARIPVIVITGHSDPSYRSLSEGIGATAHVTKPFSARELVETVRRVLGERPA